jgi:hypothetical protein
MVTLILILHLSVLFGGEIDASLKFTDRVSCRRLLGMLDKFSLKYTVVQDCGPQAPAP